MKLHLFLTILAILTIAACSSPTAPIIESSLSLEVQKASKDSVKNWLKAGNYTAQIMDKYTGGQRAEELSQKFNEAIAANQEWFLEFSKTIPEGETMPYHENLGLTREEYDELEDIYKKSEVISSGEQPITVLNGSGWIQFKGEGKLEFLSSIKYHIEDNHFSFWTEGDASPPMVLKETINVSGHKGAYREWNGFKWRYTEGLSEEEAESLTNFDNISVVDLSVTIGKTIDDLIVLTFDMQVVQDGQSLTGGRRKIGILFK